MTKTSHPNAKKLLHSWLLATGLSLLILGALIFTAPQMMEDYLGISQVDAPMFAGIFLFAGVMDIVIARIFFKGRDRR